MKQSRTFVSETPRKKMGRPLIDKDDGVAATTVAVRLPPKVLAVVDDYAAEMGGLTRSKAVRDMLTHAIEEWAKIKKRRKP
jgi:Ribbon-helix-helix protein, copG family